MAPGPGNALRGSRLPLPRPDRRPRSARAGLGPRAGQDDGGSHPPARADAEGQGRRARRGRPAEVPRREGRSCPADGKLEPPAPKPTYTDVFGGSPVRLAGEDERVIAVTAAMAEGTGLVRIRRSSPSASSTSGSPRRTRSPSARPRRPRDAPDRRDLLDLPAARLRPDHPRRRPPAPAGRLLPRPGRAGGRGRSDPPRLLRSVLPRLHSGDGRSRPRRTRARSAICSGRRSAQRGGPVRDSLPARHDPGRDHPRRDRHACPLRDHRGRKLGASPAR